MATKATATFKPDVDYCVQVATVVKVAGLTIRPSQGGTIKGVLADRIKDQILSFEEVIATQE